MLYLCWKILLLSIAISFHDALSPLSLCLTLSRLDDLILILILIPSSSVEA